MSEIVLIMGKSGSGKTSSLRNFAEDEILYIDVEEKALPFRKKFKETLYTDNYGKIWQAIKQTKKNVIVIDDMNYLLTNTFMGDLPNVKDVFRFYDSLARNYWQLITGCKHLSNNKIVYMMSHVEQTDYGTKPKTIGKMLDEKVCIEGMFTTVLTADFNGTEHIFKTKSNPLDCTKTPMDMFSDEEISNDLKLVDTIIREYYEMEE